MPFYKCKLINRLSRSSYNVEQKLLYAVSREELLEKHGNITSYQRCTERRADIEEFVLRFFRTMHRLTYNGYNTVQALTIAVNCFNDIQKLIIQTVLLKIKQGSSFSDALTQFDKFFDSTIIETLKVSELTGRLAETTKSIIEYLEYRIQFNTKIKNAIRYPIFVLSLILVISVIWIIWIIPQFSKIFEDLDLAPLTIMRHLLAVGNFIKTHYLLLFSTLSIIISFLRCLKVKIPIISSFKTKINKLQFFESMTLMLRENVNLIETVKCVTSRSEFKRYSKLKDLITSGNSFALASEHLGLFDSKEIAIISVSEQVGQYWVAFKTFSDITRLRIEDDINRLTKRLPSILMCIVGLLLVFFIYSTFIPLYSSIDIVVSNPM